MFGFHRVPTGWQACDGSLLSIAEYETLYTLIGTTYGGDGVSTFAVPDLRGRVPLHWGNGQGLTPRVLGQVGGSESVTLLSTQLPSHSHPMFATTATAEATKVASTVELGTWRAIRYMPPIRPTLSVPRPLRTPPCLQATPCPMTMQCRR
ncbi:tail fiber protein [Ensifer sp. 1H6]|uniref:phage tail protein n=1 Tax=Ensifer sp. 1H6 TaxID=1911585 RepID=UPI001FDA8751|nr:tail fiber protein [Ensifer sp. 1H6]